MAKIYGYTRPAAGGPAHSDSTSTLANQLNVELDAMKQIAEAVSSLPDRESRARVLRWVAERLATFSETQIGESCLPAPRLSPDPAPAGAQMCASTEGDSSLTVDGIEALFEQPRNLVIAGASDPTATNQAGEATVSMVDGFVKEFQKLARDWDGR